MKKCDKLSKREIIFKILFNKTGLIRKNLSKEIRKKSSALF